LKQPGIIGSAIINSRTTLIIDVFEAVKTLFPDWMSQMAQKQQAKTGGGTLLFVEDSDFFRRQVKGFLEDGGYRVIEAKNGQEAWSILTKEYRDIDLVITDLEMPKMNGFELTEKIRSDDRVKHFTVIALTSLAGEADIVKGKQVGINDYQIKMDRGKLLDTVKRHLEKIRS
jgi:two-component system chemotaxis sensor kinase CheA